MDKIRITKEFSFETGHALYGYDGNAGTYTGIVTTCLLLFWEIRYQIPVTLS